NEARIEKLIAGMNALQKTSLPLYEKLKGQITKSFEPSTAGAISVEPHAPKIGSGRFAAPGVVKPRAGSPLNAIIVEWGFPTHRPGPLPPLIRATSRRVGSHALKRSSGLFQSG